MCTGYGRNYSLCLYWSLINPPSSGEGSENKTAGSEEFVTSGYIYSEPFIRYPAPQLTPNSLKLNSSEAVSSAGTHSVYSVFSLFY